MPMTCRFPLVLLTTVLSPALPLPARADAPTPPSPTALDAVQVRAAASRAPALQAGSYGRGDWLHTPASLQVLDRDLIDRRQVRTLSELASSDAALGDSYAPVGYYQNIAIRGFALDPATAYRFNGLAIAGEQRLALEHVQQVEILKGDAGLAAGVIAPGGLVNYVGKRPQPVRALSLASDAEGTRYAAVDLGGWLTPRLGLRLNLANEALRTPVDHTDGQRQFQALAADWQTGPRSRLELDLDHQRSRQRSVSGYQLLGGTTIPARVDPQQLPGYQPWQQPVAIASSNIGLRQTIGLGDHWQAQLALGHSRSRIDDNVAFAYGCHYRDACADGVSPGQFFAPDGSYDIYDYRSPDDTRRNRQLRATLDGSVHFGHGVHRLQLGIDRSERRIDKRDAVYEYVGSGHVRQRQPPLYAPSPQQPGPRVRRLDSRQDALLLMDRIELSPHWQWLAGGRQVRLDERRFAADGSPEGTTRLSRFLPQAALLWQPGDASSAYISYAQGLSLGQEAPYWTSNGGSILPARLSRQLELGGKYRLADGLALSAALFRTRLPWQYARPDDSVAGFSFVQAGTQLHTGLELGASGRIGGQLQLQASAIVLQARVRATGTPAYEGHDLVNVPPRRASVQADYQLPALPQLGVSLRWRHAAANPATADGRVRVPAWHVFDAGLRWQQQHDGHALVWQLTVDNVLDRFHWRDTGSSFGDHFLFPGAPRQARLSLRIEL